LEALTGDPTPGLHMVREVEASIRPPSSLVAFYARDYRDGLARLARFKRPCMPEQLRITEARSTFREWQGMIPNRWREAHGTDRAFLH